MRTQRYSHLSAAERETVSLGLAHGHSLRTMASVLGRAPSPVSREVGRNTIRGHPSRACAAQTQAATRARPPRRPRKLLDPWLWQSVQTHLRQGCSPEQIAGRLRRVYPDDMRKHVSPETIDVGLYVLPRGTLRSELLAALRQACKTRWSRARGIDRGGQLPNMTPIAERPAEVATRTVPGHWEGDLLKGHAISRPSAAGGADDAPGHPGPDGGDGCDEGPRGLHQETPARACLAAQDPDVRSRQGDGRARAVGPAARNPRLRCRPTCSLATRHEREHQWPAASIPPQGHSPLGLQPTRVERHCPSVEHAPEKMSRLCDASGSLCATAPSFTCCTWNLKPPIQRPECKAGVSIHPCSTQPHY